MLSNGLWSCFWLTEAGVGELGVERRAQGEEGKESSGHSNKARAKVVPVTSGAGVQGQAGACREVGLRHRVGRVTGVLMTCSEAWGWWAGPGWPVTSLSLLGSRCPTGRWVQAGGKQKLMPAWRSGPRGPTRKDRGSHKEGMDMGSHLQALVPGSPAEGAVMLRGNASHSGRSLLEAATQFCSNFDF